MDLGSLNPQIVKPKVTFVELNQKKPLTVVDIAKPKLQQIPQKATAASVYNSTVQEEQVSTGIKTTQPQKQNVPKSQPAKEQSQNKTSNINPNNIPQKQQTHTPQSLPPSNPQTAASGGDFLPKIKIGNTTYLNTEAIPHAGYIVELKRRFTLAWNPIPVLRAQLSQLPPGSIKVVLGLTVDSQGNLLKAFVLNTSGVPSYDAECLRTVKASAPFSAPPANFLENGLVNMTWGFIVNR